MNRAIIVFRFFGRDLGSSPPHRWVSRRIIAQVLILPLRLASYRCCLKGASVGVVWEVQCSCVGGLKIFVFQLPVVACIAKRMENWALHSGVFGTHPSDTDLTKIDRYQYLQ